MNISTKILKTARTLYLYGDGHAVIVHQKRDKDAGYVDWVTVHQSIGVQAQFKGRLIVSDKSAMAMLLAAKTVRCQDASVTHGSDNTRKLDIAVGSVSFDFGAGFTHFNLLPGLISCDFHYQDDKIEIWEGCADSLRWSDYVIGGRYPDKTAATSELQAA